MLFDVRGLKLHAIDRGQGRPTLLLHGWLDHAHSFDLLAPLLPGRTVALDFRGHGDSQWVGAGGFYHFIEYVADLDEDCEQLSSRSATYSMKCERESTPPHSSHRQISHAALCFQKKDEKRICTYPAPV